jgi:hypothetical protein
VSLSATASAQLEFLATGATPASARSSPVSGWFGNAAQPPNPAVVRVIAPERNGASLGSGTLVDVNDKYGLVLTNWHVVKDAAGNVIVSFPDGFQTPGYIVKTDRDWDLAAVAIWRPQAKPVPLAANMPQRGEPLTIAGYGSGNYRAQSGRCTQYLAPGPNMPYDIVEISAAARHGDSGGPILNSRGELAGVLFGEGGGRTAGSAAARVHCFVASLGIQPSSDTPTQIAQAATPGKPAQSEAPLTSATLLPSPLAGEGPGVRVRVAATTGIQSSAPPCAANLVAVAPTTTNLPPLTYPATDAPPLTLAPLHHEADGSIQPRATESSRIGRTPQIAEQLAAKTPLLVSTAPMSTSNIQSAQQITLEDLVGHTGGQQLKTALAALGVLFVLYQLSRRIA